MKNSIKILPLFAAVLSVTGCLFGGGGDDQPAFTKIAPGLYTADYSGVADPQGYGLEEEISINDDGSYRMFWLSHNDPVLDQRGSWSQNVYDARNGNALRFSSVKELWIGQSDSLLPADDDTNSVINVSGNSFTRLEYTPFRQKPLWIKYTLQSYPTIKDGDYFFAQAADSTHSPTTIKISFSGSDFSYTYSDTAEKYQAHAKWFQIGTILATTNNAQRYFSDSLKAFPDQWDSTSLSSEILQRVRNVADSGFEMFNAPPPGVPDSGSWTFYRRKNPG